MPTNGIIATAGYERLLILGPWPDRHHPQEAAIVQPWCTEYKACLHQEMVRRSCEVESLARGKVWQKGEIPAEGQKRCKKWITLLHPCTLFMLDALPM
jgi:hypothetical protein